ncbi:MAG: FHA domain-containing protein [Candidatus Dormibacteria bacterium]
MNPLDAAAIGVFGLAGLTGLLAGAAWIRQRGDDGPEELRWEDIRVDEPPPPMAAPATTRREESLPSSTEPPALSPALEPAPPEPVVPVVEEPAGEPAPWWSQAGSEPEPAAEAWEPPDLPVDPEPVAVPVVEAPPPVERPAWLPEPEPEPPYEAPPFPAIAAAADPGFPDGAARVRVIDGPDAGQARPLPPGVAVSIGRSAVNDLRLEDAALSRVHCRLTWDEPTGQVVLEDLGSVNGTEVDGERISRVELKPGQTFRVGRCTIAVEV